MKKLIQKLVKEEKGQGMTEYGLILGLIALAAVVALTAFGGQISTKFNEIVDALTGAGTTSTTETTPTTQG